MASGADPFSILNKGQASTRYSRPNAQPKVNMYRPGKKPVLQGNNSESSSDEDDHNIFSETNTQISDLTVNTKITFDDIKLQSKIIKKTSQKKPETKPTKSVIIPKKTEKP